MEETPSAKTYLGWGVTILGGVAVLAALLLALWHLFLWLRDGIWPSFSGAAMLAGLSIPYPAAPWGWAQGLIDWLFAWSAAGLLTSAGILFVIIGTLMTSEHDQKMAALATGAAQRAAHWVPREEDGEEGDEPDPIDDDEEEEPDAPPPPAPRTPWQATKDNLLGCGCIVLLIVGGLALFIGWDYFDRRHYNRVSARILTVTPSCLLEWEPPRDPAFWESSVPRRSEDMACAEAWRQARAWPQGRGPSPRVIERLAVTYTFTSPIDGRTHDGRLHRDAIDFPPGVRAGGEMPVYSLKADPDRSRGIYQWPVD